ncbi:MAG TPA: hypothetical protein VFO55_13645 [Gemmatimonadaceae bacterium]|nr:hypothetical protein [Gemmatimonadaceae bacterium]
MAVTKERAERIARGHACENCGEYTIKKLKVVRAPEAITEELKVVWIVKKTCGVCDMEQELGIEADGDIAFVQ